MWSSNVLTEMTEYHMRVLDRLRVKLLVLSLFRLLKKQMCFEPIHIILLHCKIVTYSYSLYCEWLDKDY